MTLQRRYAAALLALLVLLRPAAAQTIIPTVDANFWAELAVKVEAMSPAEIAGAAGRVEQTVAVTAGRFNPYTGAAVIGGGLIVGALDYFYNQAKLQTGTSMDDYYKSSFVDWYHIIGAYKCAITDTGSVYPDGQHQYTIKRYSPVYSYEWAAGRTGTYTQFTDQGSIAGFKQDSTWCDMPTNWYDSVKNFVTGYGNYSRAPIWNAGSPTYSASQPNHAPDAVMYTTFGPTTAPPSATVPLSNWLSQHPDSVTAIKQQVLPKYLDAVQPSATPTPWPGVTLSPPPTPTQWSQTDPVPVGQPTVTTTANPDGGSTTTSTQPYDNGTRTVTTITSTPVATRNPDGTTTTTITTTSSAQKYDANGQPVGSPVVTTTSTTSTSTPVSTTSTSTTNPDGGTTTTTTTNYSDGTKSVTTVTTGTVTNPDGSKDTTTTTTVKQLDKNGNVVGTPKVTSTVAHTPAPDPTKANESEANCTASGGTWTGTSCTPAADPAKTACLTAGGTYADGVCTPNPTKPPPFVQANCTRGTLAVSSFVSDFFGTLRAVFVPCKDHFTELRDAVKTKFPFSIGAGLNNLMTPAGGSTASPLPTDIGWFHLDFAPYAVFFSLSQLLWKSFLTIALVVWLVGKASGQLVIN
jgi:hypothetical protein